MEDLAPKKNIDVVVDKHVKGQGGKEAKVQVSKTYTFEEASEASKKYFKGDELAATVWANKYALKDSLGKIHEQTPDDMHHRIAREISRIEKRYSNPLSEDEVLS